MIGAIRQVWEPSGNELHQLVSDATVQPLAYADVVIVHDLPPGGWRLVEPAVPLASGTIQEGIGYAPRS